VNCGQGCSFAVEATTGLLFRRNDSLCSYSCIHLDLSQRGITSLAAGTFDGLLNLRELYLNFNQLTNVSHQAFGSVPNLKVLSLYGNRISDLPNNVFRGLPALETISIDRNDLKSLDFGVFKDLNRLKVLILGRNPLTTLFKEGVPLQDYTQFDQNISSVQQISLYGTNLRQIPMNFFRIFPQLIFLELSGSPVSTISDNAFEGAQNLQQLMLMGMSLIDINETTFKGLSNNLKGLQLFSNKIQRISHKAFQHLSGLQVLGLESNMLTVLPRNVFSNISARVLLSGNPLACLPENVARERLSADLPACPYEVSKPAEYCSSSNL
jgi:Leucine-rich repeat (LRR) protein